MFVDAPHILRPVDVSGQLPDGSSGLFPSEDAGAAADPSLTPRAWWDYNRDTRVVIGLKESIELIRDVLRTRKFDVGPLSSTH